MGGESSAQYFRFDRKIKHDGLAVRFIKAIYFPKGFKALVRVFVDLFSVMIPQFARIHSGKGDPG